MIKANELRLGNWVSCEGKPYQVNINILQSFTVSPVWMDPIQLTPEILEMCGFEYGEHFNEKYSWKKAHYYIIKNDDDSFSLASSLAGMVSVHHVNLKFLHQLQNLYFALTGEELQINWPL